MPSFLKMTAIAAALACAPVALVAGDKDCVGKVTNVLDYPRYCGGNLAFKLDSTNGKWVCTLSDVSGSMILAAFTSGAKVNVRTAAETCGAIEHYHRPSYIYLFE